MQLYVIVWSFNNSEDQLFATNEFCEYLKKGKINESMDGFELKFIAHMPQNGTGTIICKSDNFNLLNKIFNIWRKNFNIKFDFNPALTNDELLASHTENFFWDKN